ncbi:alpha/beta fold hydrolase [Azoarcus sp. L1K30]|uniref:alpha/beta hydrolase n=1 Tax=Azoarcus sp. L1K30 TaxID=2820277 RepID=UPI001B82F7AA|nr:alpha/beta fold hydrolase [Azoarcus sp. L1K30]MBR0565063.1 alpha/beta fold hydrolase [Azoarcus sp. L1K30]
MNTHAAPRSGPSALLPAIEVETGPAPVASVIWLHGLGADGHDFEPVVDALDLHDLPPIRFVFPHAPPRPVTINAGYVMRAWYDIVSADFSPRREDPQGVHDAAAQIEALIARENARGVDDRNIVLAGFSQGGAIALHVGLRHPGRLAGIMALSTYVPLADTLAAELAPANRDIPIFMAHGRDDNVIPCTFGRASCDLLGGLGLSPKWVDYPADHTVTMDELHDIQDWLRESALKHLARGGY